MRDGWMDSPDTKPGNKRRTTSKGGEIGGDKGEAFFITWQSIILRRKEPKEKQNYADIVNLAKNANVTVQCGCQLTISIC